MHFYYIRKLDKDVAITLVTREPGYSYSKPMLSTAIASNKTAEQLISANTEDIATQLNLSIMDLTEVLEIDSKQQQDRRYPCHNRIPKCAMVMDFGNRAWVASGRTGVFFTGKVITNAVGIHIRWTCIQTACAPAHIV